MKNQQLISGSLQALPVTHSDWSLPHFRSIRTSIELKFYTSISLFILPDWIGQRALDTRFVAFRQDAFPAFSTVLFGLFLFLYRMPDFDDFQLQVRKRYLIMIFRDGREGLDFFHSLRTHRWSSGESEFLESEAQLGFFDVLWLGVGLLFCHGLFR